MVFPLSGVDISFTNKVHVCYDLLFHLYFLKGTENCEE